MRQRGIWMMREHDKTWELGRFRGTNGTGNVVYETALACSSGLQIAVPTNRQGAGRGSCRSGAGGPGWPATKFEIEIEIEAEEQASVISASFILHAASR